MGDRIHVNKVYFCDKICHVRVVLFPLSCARYHWPESLQTFSLMPVQWAGHRRPSVLYPGTFYGICCAVTPLVGI